MPFRSTPRNCPLCKKQLVTRYPTPPDSITRLICGTHIDGSKLSHYYVEVGNNQVEVIHTPPFSIINDSRDDRSKIYPLNIDSVGGITRQKLIVSLPRFPLGDPARLSERIKIYVLFS